MFAKPFIGALSGHLDGVYSIEKHPKNLSCLLSASADGEVKIWNVLERNTFFSVQAHNSFIRGLTISRPNGTSFLTCADDRTIKHWPLNLESINQEIVPFSTFITQSTLRGIDHSWGSNNFVSTGSYLHLWDYNRSQPIQQFSWETSESTISAKFNPVEHNIFATTGSDNSIALYDVKSRTPIRKLILDNRSNSIAWNPMEAFNFTVANEDNNCYTFDMRKMKEALCVHMDHLSAVMDIDYSPTGKEFVSGSYDKTIRIFGYDSGRSKEVYHTRRMQKIFTVRYSMDAKFIFSGSDDANIRIWKARKSEPLIVTSRREVQSMRYRNQLKQRYKNMPEIRRIARHRHLPKILYNLKKMKQEMIQSSRRKLDNIQKHSRSKKIKKIPARQKFIVTEIK
eukprot:Anaeramoba_ignava/a226530_12.p1 GENE.a226530_12~~a226530_12.p1  ORF type:complete len:396 (-),score=108.72 a226530_12:105-1292(-)